MPHEVCWFDSYGLPPDAPDLILGRETQFRARLRDICAQLSLLAYRYNTADLQGWTAKTWGHWSLWFCKHGASHGWGDFSSDLDANYQELVVLN